MKRITKAVFFIVVAVIASGCGKERQTDVTNNIEPAAIHDFVDLGLPSGTLWATCNVGADNPEDFGDYFAWGETEPKDYYDWDNYKYCICVDGIYKLNKYYDDDSLTVLEPCDDAVRANWGNEWRMPTKEEYDELYRETTFIWTKINGVYGRLLTGSNGNSIFMPATGFLLGSQFIGPGLGIYWSSSLQTVSLVSAWSLHFDWENCHVCATYERSRGHVVRAVRASK